MNTLKLTSLAAGLVIALSLSGCNNSDGSSTTSGTGTGTGTGTGSGTGTGGTGTGGTGSSLMLSSARNQLSGVLVDLGTNVQQNTPAGTPLDIGGFLIALNPAVNNLLIGPDAAVSGLLSGIQTVLANPTATGFTTAASEIQTGLTALPPAVASLAQTLPCALATLAGQRASVCTGTDPAAQLQRLIALFANGNNPFAGTPLASLGLDGAPGTPVNGPTGTPIDALLSPLLTALGTPGSASPAALDGQLVDQLGLGLATVGDAIVDGYNNIPGSGKLPMAGQLVQTLGSVIADLGISLNTLESGTDAGSTLNTTLTNVSNLLTAPSGLLGMLASASGNSRLISAVNSGNAQLNNGIDTLTSTLNTTLLTSANSAALTPVLDALAPLTCTLALFGDCSGSSSNTNNLTALVNSLTSALDISMGSGTPSTDVISSLTNALASSATNNNTLITQLVGAIDTLPLTSPTNGSTGLLGGITSGLGGLLGNLIPG